MWLSLSDASSSNHLDALCSYTWRPGASSDGGQGTRPDPDLSVRKKA